MGQTPIKDDHSVRQTVRTPNKHQGQSDKNSETSQVILGRKRKSIKGVERSPSQSFSRDSIIRKRSQEHVVAIDVPNEFKDTPDRDRSKSQIGHRSRIKMVGQIDDIVDEVESPDMKSDRQKPSIFTKAAAKNRASKQVLTTESKPQVQAIITEAIKNFDTRSEEQKVIEGLDEHAHQQIREIMAKHAFISYWHRGPDFDQRQNLFVKNDKVLIIDEDEAKDQEHQAMTRDDILGELIHQKIAPTLFIIGDRNKILQQMKAEEERVSKEKKEQETKKLIKKSDVRMTIYPGFDAFFQQYEQ